MTAPSKQQLEALAVLGQLCLLAVAISIGHFLKCKRVLWLGGAGAALLLGVVVGVGVRLVHTAPVVASWMAFQSDFFFLVLLPPIMFDACFNLDSRLFVKNLGSVCALAFAGTTLSTFAIGLNMWAAGKFKLCFSLTFLEALTFGALISATDPVTVLAIFQTLKADPDLYMNVFGESVLNDAVAMVLFQLFNSFAVHEVAVSAASIAQGVAAFCGIFLGSTALGIACGLAAAALLKPRWYYGDINLETGLMLLIGYGSYMAGTAAGLSGIVCVMFCAMVCGGYAAPNLSPGGLAAAKGVYAVLASCMEQFVFVYIGVSLFMEPQEWHCLAFTAVCLFGLAWSRAANVLPCCAAVNFLRPPELKMNRQHQLMLWWSGLRGAMAFALSVEAAKNFGEAGKVMMTCTFMVILITVLINGGSTGYLLSWFGLVQGKGAAAAAAAAGHGHGHGGYGGLWGSSHNGLVEKEGLSQQDEVHGHEMESLEHAQLLLHDKVRKKLQQRTCQQQQQQPEEEELVVATSGMLCSESEAGAGQPGGLERSEQQQFLVKSAAAAGDGSVMVASAAMLRKDSGSDGATLVRRRSSCTGAAAGSEHASESASEYAALMDLCSNPKAPAAASACCSSEHLASAAAESEEATTAAAAPCAGQGFYLDASPAIISRSGTAGSFNNILEALRSNNNQLQDSLDRWDAQVLSRWFINPGSAQAHARWQQLQQQQQQHLQLAADHV